MENKKTKLTISGNTSAGIVIYDPSGTVLGDHYRFPIDGQPHFMGAIGTLADNGIGVNMQANNLALREVLSNVTTHNNESNLSYELLPIPDLAENLVRSLRW